MTGQAGDGRCPVSYNAFHGGGITADIGWYVPLACAGPALSVSCRARSRRPRPTGSPAPLCGRPCPTPELTRYGNQVNLEYLSDGSQRASLWGLYRWHVIGGVLVLGWASPSADGPKARGVVPR